MAKQDDYVRVTVRIPADIYEAVKDAAGEKSVNAEIVARLSGQQRTLRDWFAGQALAAMSADLLRNQEYGATMRELAKKAYFVADCMLAAREAKP